MECYYKQKRKELKTLNHDKFIVFFFIFRWWNGGWGVMLSLLLHACVF